MTKSSWGGDDLACLRAPGQHSGRFSPFSIDFFCKVVINLASLHKVEYRATEIMTTENSDAGGAEQNTFLVKYVVSLQGWMDVLVRAKLYHTVSII